jgi:hypothetical protein
MDYQEFRAFMAYPAIDLLRGDNAAMVLGFLFRAFKAQHRAIVPEGQLRAILETYLEELRDAEPDKYPMATTQYLSIWCDDAHQYLRRYFLEDSSEPVFELTSGSEKALLWMEQLAGTAGFVGTEGRLDSIFKGLDDLLRNTTADVNERVKQLEADEARVREEIDRIRASGVAPTYTGVQINERFAQILSTARELLGDFRLVEDNLKRIAQAIAEQHAKPGATKGTILGNMLDANDTLRRSEQGQSFYAFWGLLLSSERREKFQQAMDRVLALDQLNEKLKSSQLLRNLTHHLLIEGEKVLGSAERMATNLRRVLDSRVAADREKVHELIQEIQALAIAVRTNPPTEPIFEVGEINEFYNAMSRPLWQVPTEMNALGPVEVADNRISKEELKAFSNLAHISLEQMRRNVREILADKQTQTLEHVLDRYPPKYGMMEVLGYLILAMEDPKHFVGEEEQIITIPGLKPTRWLVPRVLFCQ